MSSETESDPGAGLRRRRTTEKDEDNPFDEKQEEEEVKVDLVLHDVDLRGSYWLTRCAFLRSLGFIYLVAFWVAIDQNGALIGDRGLLPIRQGWRHFFKKGLNYIKNYFI